MRIITNVVGVSLVGLAANAQAQTWVENVQGLYEDCKKTQQGESIFCIGYIGGIADMMNIISVSTADRVVRRSFALCAPDGYTYGAAVQAFMNWAPKHDSGRKKCKPAW